MNKENFQNAIVEFKTTHVIKEELTQLFYQLSQETLSYFDNLENNPLESYMEDLIQEGVLICLEKLNRFNPDKGLAFNYFTTCVMCHYRQFLRSLRNRRESV